MTYEHDRIISMDQLQSVLDGEVRRERRARNRNMVLGVLVFVGLWWYLGWIHSNLAQMMDEGELAALLGDYAEAELLPKAKPVLEEFLLERVPAGVDEMSRAAVAELPELRKEMLQAFALPIEAELAELDERMAEEIGRELADSRPRIERILRNLPEDERRQQMAEELAALFRTHYTVQSREMVRDFRRDLGAAESRIRHLLTSPPSELTPDQRQRRELILLAMATAESTFAGEGSSIIDVLLTAIYEGMASE
ncbi:hypothetical protein GGQ74_001083 [Desulfobaculum xiamenense]|uniref:Uncharacterized protein n=1 Tax=Desulfobaculum xiamenense TaxID=995050 RepID=A0A846QMI0_9BACT|nr:hypothetical protein [Desulfobaculum xiamenense]NJB67443.1 hypothetical protein [Desulfobaculum xiamenense]